MTNEEVEKITELVAVICKDTYLRKKLILKREFMDVVLLLNAVPGLPDVVEMFAEREANNVRGEV